MNHGANLEDGVGSAKAAQADLAIEDRTARGKLDQERGQKDQRRGQGQQNHGDAEFRGDLESAIKARWGPFGERLARKRLTNYRFDTIITVDLDGHGFHLRLEDWGTAVEQIPLGKKGWLDFWEQTPLKFRKEKAHQVSRWVLVWGFMQVAEPMNDVQLK
jgi:hypothetical protein